MTRGIKLAAVLGVVVTLGGCAGVQSPVGNGALFTSVQAPVAATSNAQSTKTGSAKCFNVLGVVAVGDASITAASREAGITQIHHVDHNSFSVLRLYSSFETVVYGE